MSLRIEVLSAKGLTLDTEYCQTFQVHILMQNEVVTSGPVTADEEGDIVFDYSAQLSSLSGQAASLGAAGLIQHQCPVLVYISSKPAESLIGGTTCSCLVAAAVIDFRFSLFFSSEYMSVELLQCDQDGVNLGVEAGVLYVRMTPMGLPDKIQYELEETSARQAVEHGIQSYQEKLTTSNKLLYRHARSWWSRVRRMHPHIESRNIRILAEDECGSHRFACCMLSPVTPPRELLSPRFAARFVSLVPLRTDPGLRGGRSDGWRSAFATICRMQGSTEDHALLLCSLLLGWGLDAWVAMGVATEPADDEDEDAPAKESPCSWVVTFEHDADRPAFPTVTFWDAVNGTQFEDVTGAATGEVGSHHFKELHALFNDKVFAVNVQHLTAVTSDGFSRSPAVMSFDLSSERNFQILSFPEAEAAQIMTHPGASLGLRASVNTVDICAQEVQLEEKIKKEFRSWRSEIELQTHYDDKIAVVLQPALVSYEWNKTVKVSIGNADFHAAMKKHVKKGDVFKGCPVSFNHTDCDEIMRALKRHPAIRDIAVASEGLRVSHAVRVKIFPYPEGAMAVWVMVTVCVQNGYRNGVLSG